MPLKSHGSSNLSQESEKVIHTILNLALLSFTTLLTPLPGNIDFAMMAHVMEMTAMTKVMTVKVNKMIQPLVVDPLLELLLELLAVKRRRKKRRRKVQALAKPTTLSKRSSNT